MKIWLTHLESLNGDGWFQHGNEYTPQFLDRYKLNFVRIFIYTMLCVKRIMIYMEFEICVAKQAVKETWRNTYLKILEAELRSQGKKGPEARGDGP
ncbi:unnamed protein product [Citrullus colocynthis]|uniref:Uncharacterized protein n=1 Tax=Citrullus colocynthis TaxID=252529 RepID=A0ABP0Z2L2_9ROSI